MYSVLRRNLIIALLTVIVNIQVFFYFRTKEAHKFTCEPWNIYAVNLGFSFLKVFINSTRAATPSAVIEL